MLVLRVLLIALRTATHTMSSQQQDLIFFADGTLLSNHLASRTPWLSIISHHDGTAPMWLATALVENCLVGTANLVNRDLKPFDDDCSVTFVSFLHSREFFEKSCRKLAVDIGTLPKFTYLDFSQSLFTSDLPKGGNISLLFEKISTSMLCAKASKRVVFLEAPELLLTATELPSTDLLLGIKRLLEHASVIPILNVHPSLVDLGVSFSQDHKFRITDFYVKLHHMSSMNISLQPLSTGKAKDITGSLTVTRGSVPCRCDSDIVEREYVFQVNKDAKAQLYYR